MPTEITTLAEVFLGHLVREEACLQAARESLSQLHEAFLRGDLVQLQQSLDQASQMADWTQQTREERERVCRQMAEILDLDPDTVNLSAVSARMPAPYSTRIQTYRDRLQVLVAEVERLSVRTSNAAGFCRNFIQRTISEMTDGKAAVTHYGPTHRREAARVGALLTARG